MNQDAQKPDVFLGIAEWLPDQFEAEAFETIVASGTSIRVVRIPSGPYAGVELYLPTAVGLFITGAFFTGFVSRAGEDAYEALKRATRALWRKITGLEIKSIGSLGKIRNTEYSSAFAIGCEIHSRLRAKLLIAKSASEEDVEQAVSAFVRLMGDIHAGLLSPERLKELIPYAAVGGTVLMTYDANTAMIVAVNGLADPPVAPVCAQKASE